MNSETLISPPNKSSSSWLRRLRSARGFPDSDHTDLDHFLATVSIHPQSPTPQPPLTGKHVRTESVTEHDSITNLLSQLFHMGEFQHTSGINTKKTSRKQPSPRMCPISTNSDSNQNISTKKDTVSLSLLNVSLNSRNKVKEVKIVEEEDEEKCDWDVSGYSQTEITVIDTSVASWKFDKVLYRRKNVWKVGNKKGKGLMNGDMKKRKECVNENGDVAVVHKKKLKLCNSLFKSQDSQKVDEKKKKMMKKKKKKLKLCNSLKYADKEGDMIRSKPAQVMLF